MSRRLRIGEAGVILYRANPHIDGRGLNVGDEVTVYDYWDAGYRAVGANSAKWRFYFDQLAPKDPPPERPEIGEWDLCPWRPKHNEVQERT